MKPTGYLLHEGITNGSPFVAIATLSTANRKTGNMVQVWFLLRNVNPVQAVQEAIDADTVCNGCPFASGKGCYVNVGQAPLAIWKGFHRGIYPTLHPKDYATVFSGRKVRFGAYGNPSLLPVAMVKAIAQASAGWTGYFHDWRSNPYAKEYANYFMVSTETESSYKLAQSLSFRVFHVSPNKPANAVECLADSTNGRVQCATCKLACNGGERRNVWIAPHGSRENKAIQVSLT